MNTELTMDHGVKSFECNPCKRHEQKSEAKFWCEQCSEAFCEKCNSMHSWMKLLMTHDVVSIEDVGSETSGLNLTEVSEYCRMHPLKMVEVFCFQHKTPCCGLCAGIDHRKCDNVKQIEEIVHSSEMYTGSSLLGSLNDIKESTKTVLQAKEQEMANINVIAENTEEDATNFIHGIRSKLDICFEVFKKQLTVFRDEQNTRLNKRIRLLEQLIQSIEQWIKVIEVVQTSGSIIQLFVHVETVKQQIETSIKEMEHLCSSDTDIRVHFKQNETLQKLESVDQIGFFSMEEKEIEINQLSDVFKMCSKIGICVPKFEDISIEHSRTMHFPRSKLTCGVCIADKFILLGDATTNQKMLHLVDRTGLTISKTGITGDVKRLYFDKDINRIFISCYSINHRKCDNVNSIEKIVHSSGIYKTLLEKLNDIRESTTTLLQAKQQEKANIKVMAENTEENATNFIQGIRSKLDICFEPFKKQLTVFHDEQNTRLNIRIRLLEQLIQSIEHWARVTEVVQTSGSITQLFLHVETVKKQIENSTTELEQICGSDIDIYLSFKKNETLQKVESVDQIGSLSIEEREKDTNQMGDLFKMCSNFEICIPRFEGIRIEYIRTMHMPGTNLICGVCIADKYILLGDTSTNPKYFILLTKQQG
ncbi:unnamed protein product [Mytilus edulis]|uniref:B box-type domain-containing protein n=1 Tax=Mytilus edulis TaxID=6550 RepID=A0A8S3QSA3_MYTED|nr:unnamed protein product [Mytilus edulis]